MARSATAAAAMGGGWAAQSTGSLQQASRSHRRSAADLLDGSIGSASSWTALPEIGTPNKAAASTQRAASPPKSPVLRSVAPRRHQRGHASSSTKDPFAWMSTENLFREMQQVALEAGMSAFAVPQRPCAGFRGAGDLPQRRSVVSSGAAWGAADHFVLAGGTVPPSIGFEDEAMLLDQPGTLESLQAGQILMPSGDLRNDSTRIRNAGSPRRGHSIGGRGSRSTGLSQSTSAPSLEASPPPKTPRTFRGLCRRVSVESLKVPEVHGLDDDDDDDFLFGYGSAVSSTTLPAEPLERRPRPPSHLIAPEEADGPDWRPPVGKSVMWKPTNEGWEKSKQILDALFQVRRSGKDEPKDGAESEPPKSARKADAAEDAPLFKATLMDVKDTSTSLMKLGGALKDGSQPVYDVGGGRHPSAVIAMRTLMVVQRKMALVRAIEQRFLAFEAAHARKEANFKSIADGRMSVPSEMVGIASFLKAHTHQGCEPQDANKSDFKAFAKSFGLPSKHHIIIKLNRLAGDAMDWWTAETLARARQKAGADELKRLLAVITGMEAPKTMGSGTDIQEISVALGDRLAEQVLTVAENLLKKDAFAVSRSEVPQVESAQKCSAEIIENIKEAVAMGAPTKHPCLEQANGIAVQLQAEAKARIAQKALLHAKAQQMRDDTLVEAAGPDGLVQVGPATGFAESIEDAVKKAIKEGAPKNHEYLEEAIQMAKSLREADTNRKRLMKRAERLKQQAEGNSAPKKKKKG